MVIHTILPRSFFSELFTKEKKNKGVVVSFYFILAQATQQLNKAGVRTKRKAELDRQVLELGKEAVLALTVPRVLTKEHMHSLALHGFLDTFLLVGN